MPVRVLVIVTTPNDAIADKTVANRVEHCRRVEAEEPGCLQYEVFRSASHPNRFIISELWASKRLYDKHWQAQLEREKTNPPPAAPVAGPNEPASSATVEFYEQHVYKVIDGVWIIADESERSETIRWAP